MRLDLALGRSGSCCAILRRHARDRTQNLRCAENHGANFGDRHNRFLSELPRLRPVARKRREMSKGSHAVCNDVPIGRICNPCREALAMALPSVHGQPHDRGMPRSPGRCPTEIRVSNCQIEPYESGGASKCDRLFLLLAMGPSSVNRDGGARRNEGACRCPGERPCNAYDQRRVCHVTVTLRDTAPFTPDPWALPSICCQRCARHASNSGVCPPARERGMRPAENRDGAVSTLKQAVWRNGGCGSRTRRKERSRTLVVKQVRRPRRAPSAHRER